MLQPKPKDSLPPEKMEQLDANIKSMLNNGASQEDVMSYASDFKQKFGLKKKNSSDSTDIPMDGQLDSENATSDIETPKEPSVRELYNQNISLTDNDQLEIESRFKAQDGNDPERKTRKQIENDILFRKKEEFLETLDKSQLTELQQQEIKKIDSLSSENRQIDFEIGLLNKEANDLKREVERMNFSVNQAKKNGQLTPEGSLALQNRYQEIYNRSKEIEREYNQKVEKFNSNKEDIGDFSSELELFKKNWDVWDNAVQTMKLVGARGVNSFMQVWNDLGEMDQKATFGGLGNVVEAFQGDEFIKQIEKEEQYLKPKRSITEIQTPEDFGEYAIESVSEQIPILMQIMGTGIATIGIGAFGGKKQEFERENKTRREKGLEEISDSAVIAASLATAGNETIGAVIDKIGLKLAGRTIASMGTRSIKEPIKKFGKQLLLEEGEEVLFGTWSNNAIDKYVMGKDIDITEGTLDVIAKTGITVGLLNGTPAITGHVVGKFTDANDKKTLTINIGKVKELQSALEKTQSQDLKISLQSKIDSYLKQNKEIINKTRLKINSFPEETLKQLAEIERNQQKQKDAITEIEKDPNIDPDTKQKLIGEFSSDIEQNEQSKQALLNAKEETPTAQEAEQEVLPEQGKNIKEISISELNKYVEFDREVQPRNEDTPTIIENLAEDIKKNGIKEPLQLNLYNGNAILVEGNHRIVAAKRAGLKTVPVEIVDESEKLKLDDGLTVNPTKILHESYARKAKPFNVNETTQAKNTDVDGNVQPTTGPISDSTTDQNVQPTVEPTASQATTEVTPKTYKLSESDSAPEYNVIFDNGRLNIVDSKGKEPSSKTKRKVMEKYADDLDFDKGDKAVIPDGFDGNINEYVSQNSNNPLEIAQLLNDTNTDSFIENQIDFKTRIIADAIGGNIERSSYVNFGDANNIGINMAKSYFSKKGEGRQIDTLAQELSEDNGIEITPQDIVEHMETYQGGKNDVYKDVRDTYITPLKEAFTRTTGLPATDKFIAKAIESQRKNDTDYQLTDVYSDEQLLNLLNERQQATEEQAAETAQTAISDEGRIARESGRQDETGPRVQEESGPDGRGQETAAERTKIPQRSPQEERGSQGGVSSLFKPFRDRLEKRKTAAEKERSKRLTKSESIDLEKKVAADYAKENGLWIEPRDFYNLGDTSLEGGHEHTLVLNESTGEVFKQNNLANSQNSISNLFDAIDIHNKLFPKSAYELVGFSGIDSSPNRTPLVEPVFKQKYVANATKAEPSEIKAYMESIGFEQRTPESYYNGQYLVSDLYPRNVLKDPNVNLHVVDAMYQEVSEPNQNTETDNVEAQGVANNRGRDAALTEGGPVINRTELGEKIKRFWNNTFKSNQGAPKEVANTIRSLGFEMSAITDAIEYEAGQLKRLVKKGLTGNPKQKLEKQRNINEYLSGNKDVDVTFLSISDMDALDVLRGRIDGLSTKLQEKLQNHINKLQERANDMKEGSIGRTSIENSIERTNQLIETIEANKGVYLYRSYQAFNDSKYLDRLSSKNPGLENKRRIQKAVDYVMAENDGMSEKEARAQIFEYLDNLRGNTGMFGAAVQGKANAPFLKKRKQVPQAIRELLGESKDPLLNYVTTTFQISRYLANLEYQDRLLNVLEQTGLMTYEAQPGYTQLVSQGEGWQILQGVYVPKELKNSIEDLMPLATVQDGFYKAMIKFAAFTKIGKTVFSPTTVSRNFLSGIYLGINAGFFFASNPKRMLGSFRQAYGTKKSLSERRLERDKLIRLGVLNDGAISQEIVETMNDYTKDLDRLVKSNSFNEVIKFSKKIYALGDDFYKVIGFYQYKERYKKNGMSEIEAEQKAADRIRDTFPTYSLIPRNFQILRRIPVVGTFVSFPYEVLRTTNNGLKYIAEDISEGRNMMAMQQVAGMIVANATLFGLSMLTRSMLGLDDEDDDAIRDMLPDYQKNSSLIYTGKENGKPVFIDGTALFPGEVWIKPIRTLIEKRQGRDFDEKMKESLKELLTPYLGIDISFKASKNLVENNDDYDRKIYKGENLLEGILNDPDKIANYYMKQAGPGIYNNFTEFMRANEINPEMFGDKYTSFGREYNNRDAIMALVGFRFSTLNYNSGMISSAYAAKDKFTDVRNDVLKRVSSTRKISEDEMKGIVDEYSAANKELFERIQFTIKGARKLGLKDADIENSLIQARFSKTDVYDFIDGVEPFLKPISKTSEKNKVDKLQINYDDPKKRKMVIDNYYRNIDMFNDLINNQD